MSSIVNSFSRPALVLVAAVLALLIISAAGPATPAAEARLPIKEVFVNDDNCYSTPKKCNNFLVTFRFANRSKVQTPATICWLGNCRSAYLDKYDGERFLRARFSGVGPYRCGTPTKVTLKYKGRDYTKRTRITCYGQ